MSFNVGEIVTKLRLDKKGWKKSIKKVKKDMKKMGKLAERNNVELTLNIKVGQ